MADLTVQETTRAGITPTANTAASGGDAFVNTGKELVRLINSSGGSLTITFATPATVDGLDVAERAVAVAASSSRIVGPFPTGTYNDGASKVQMTYSSETGLTIEVYKPGT